MRFTKATAERLTLPSGKYDFIAWDDDLPGFGLRLRAGGSRVWIAQYRTDTGQRRETIGRADRLDVDAARKAARKILAKVELGHDPAAEKREKAARKAQVFGAFFDRYLAFKRKQLRLKSYVEVERYLRHDAASLHNLSLTSITRANIAKLVGDLAESAGPAAADRCRTALSSFFVWLIGQGVLEANPVNNTTTYYDYKPRDRVLTDDELRSVWKALPADYDAVPDNYAVIVKLLALTGQRRQEIGALRWSEVDLDAAIITLPPERTKNHRAHIVPLSAPAVELLRRVPHFAGRDLVFGSTGEGGYTRWHVSKQMLDKQARIEPWTLHDLRRTMVTKMGEDLGILPHVVEALANHVSGHKAGVAGVYNKAVYAAEKRQALDRWADHLMAIVEDRASNVTPLRRA
jgi:integrase